MARADRQEFMRAAVRLYGMVIISLAGGELSIRWSVKDADDQSLESAIQFLTIRENLPAVQIEYLYGGWERRTAENAPAAAAMLRATRRLRAAEPIVRPFVKRMSLSALPDAQPTLQSGYDAWRKTEGIFSKSVDSPWLRHLDRYLVFSPDPSTKQLVYRYLGSNAALIKVKGQRWAASVVGKSCGRALEGGPSASMLSEGYGEVLDLAVARFDHVRACIPRADGEIEWVPYQRLLLPVRSSTGRPMLLCLSATTPEVSIPVPVQIASNAIGLGG